jgi:hypothetical protein
MTQRRKVVLTNHEPAIEVEETTIETVEAVETTEETPEKVVEVEPEPVKAPEKPEEPKRPNPYVRPAVALPKEEAGRRPRNIPRYR